VFEPLGVRAHGGGSLIGPGALELAVQTTSVRFAFDGCELDVQRLELRRDGHAVAVEPQVFDVLVHLLRHRDRVVSKEELLDQVWGDRFVSESALTSRIKAARRAIGDDGASQRIIRTLHGRGYRFIADVKELAAGAITQQETRAGEQRPQQRVQLCTGLAGVHLAYASVGAGPTLVKAANWLSHLDYDWESPVWRHWWRELSARYRLVRYDERGCGLSDWDVEDFSLEAWVADLESVVDAEGLDRFVLLGISQGGPVAITYAARHPERVRGLILFGSFMQGRRIRASTVQDQDEARVQVQLVRLGWGQDNATFRRVFAMQFMPDGTQEQWKAFDELQRRTTSTANAVRFVEAFGGIDVTNLVGSVSAPSLVIHSRGDVRLPLEGSRQLAALLPHSRFVILDTANHLLLEDEPAWPRFLAEIDAFIAELR
jgi:pimeloyl-ACP methyl ester carboxylesterase/DNA-binding winged helix-turn-helix (wHTH) protein